MHPAIVATLATLVAAGAAGCPGSDDGSASSSSSSGSTRTGGVLVGPPRWLGVAGERLAALPEQAPARTDRFLTSDACAQCHLPGKSEALRDARGRDVSPVGTWRSSAMALAARDPFYLAAVADELVKRPAIAADVEKTCTRCHAPAASVELGATGEAPTFALVTKETTPFAHLAREGVACTTCHQIQPTGLGTSSSFTGGFEVGWDRTIFGPFPSPTQEPMRTIVSYTPEYGSHVSESSLCATCHTVITRSRDAKGMEGQQFPEQMPYLEWLASAYANEGRVGSKATSCQGCHMPSTDADGAELDTAMAAFPTGLPKRRPFRKHVFAGANVFLSRLAAADPTWIGLPLLRADHEAQAGANEAMLKKAAVVAIEATRRVGDILEVPVRVTNTSGHKLPTGYPSRRVFLQVTVRAPDGAIVFESGRTDANGRLVRRGPTGDLLVEPSNFLPHFDVVEREDQVQIWESVPADASGAVARRPLDAHHYAKDNRLLPDGYDPKNRWAAFMLSVGTENDRGFGSADRVLYRIANAPVGARVDVRLVHQAARPSDVEAFVDAPTPAARRLFDLVTSAPPVPALVAEASITVRD